MAFSKTQVRAIVWTGSIALHVWIAAGVASLHAAPVRKKVSSIAVTESRKKPKVEAKKETPKPPEQAPDVPLAPKKSPPRTPPKAAPEAKAQPAAAPAAAAAAPEFALTLSNAGVGGGGIAVPVAAAPKAAPEVASAAPKVLAAAAPKGDVCDEPPPKPKPIKVLQPAYTEKAREAGIEGRVRVEITVDESGKVSAARVLQGLGHGLDEAALEAARGSTFAAATRCGKSVASTFVIGMRFAL